MTPKYLWRHKVKTRIKTLIMLLVMHSSAGSAVAAEPAVQRVISAGGSISEWLVAVGGEAHLVGVDTTSLHPARLQDLPSVGYQRQLAAEGVLTLQPQLLIGSAEMGPPPVLEQL